MTAVAFDTLKFARSLRDKAKLSAEQAEGMADAIAEVLQGDIATKADVVDIRKDIDASRLAAKADAVEVRKDIDAFRLAAKADLVEVQKDIDALRNATKFDIADVRKDIEVLRLATKADIDALRLSTKADIEASKAEIMKWMFGTVGFQTLLIIGAVIALARNLR